MTQFLFNVFYLLTLFLGPVIRDSTYTVGRLRQTFNIK